MLWTACGYCGGWAVYVCLWYAAAISIRDAFTSGVILGFSIAVITLAPVRLYHLLAGY
ncbi:hypothetical protein BDV19DRAFT_365085 [Aspergillus venezuelensis]